MFGLLRAGGFVSALITLTTICASPSLAAETVPALPAPVTFTLPANATPAAIATPKIGTVNPFASLPAIVRPVALVANAPQPPRSLHDLVTAYVNYGDQDAQELCLAKAIYFEARSETLEGQLAVADVVLNRSESGVYPATICEVVVQPAQFSFIRRGKFPAPDMGSRAWHRAAAIAAIARKNLVQVVPPNVLWYHADYVSPSWGRRLTRVAQIGTHIFYS